MNNEHFTLKEEAAFYANIFVGQKPRYTGQEYDLDHVHKICQDFVDGIGQCVTVTPTKYIYTNGNENGVIVGFIQYPRFPMCIDEILGRAIELGKILATELEQLKVTVVTPERSIMIENHQTPIK